MNRSSDESSGSVPGSPGNAVPELLPGVYAELRAVAEACLRRERPDHTLQPTALVHEAYMRLAELSDMDFRDEAHFAGAAAGAMRRVLVDHARAKHAVKRGGQWHRLTLSGMGGVPDERVIDILALDEAMHRLAKLDERCVRIVELRYFGGLTIEQTARVIGVGVTTIKEKWEFARVWLRRELEQDTGS